MSTNLNSYLSFHLSTCMSIYVSIHLSICMTKFILSAYLCIFLLKHTTTALCLSIFLFVFLSSYLSIYLSIYLPICPSVYLSTYLFVLHAVYCLSIYLSLCLSACLFMSVYLSVDRLSLWLVYVFMQFSHFSRSQGFHVNSKLPEIMMLRFYFFFRSRTFSQKGNVSSRI